MRRGQVDALFLTTAGEGLRGLAGPRGFAAFMPNPVDAAVETGRAFEAAEAATDLVLPAGDDSPRQVGDKRLRPSDALAHLRLAAPGLRVSAPGLEGPRLRGRAYFEALEGARIGWALSRWADQPLYASDRMAHMLGSGLATLLDRGAGFQRFYGEDEAGFYDGLDRACGPGPRLAGRRRAPPWTPLAAAGCAPGPCSRPVACSTTCCANFSTTAAARTSSGRWSGGEGRASPTLILPICDGKVDAKRTEGPRRRSRVKLEAASVRFAATSPAAQGRRASLDTPRRRFHPAPMIPRYSRPAAADIWSPQTRYRIWFEIEAHAASAMAELGTIPAAAAQAIWAKGRDATFDAERIDEIERVTKHDVIAFLTHVAEIVGEEARFLHQGMTSSDVLDTCLAVQLARSADLLIEDVDLVLAALKRRAFEHRLTPTVGRSHGIHAEPTTFGLKLAGHYAEFVRARRRLQDARAEIATCAISGAVGTYANVDPRVEQYVADRMGLTVEPVSTQVIPRDRHAAFFAALAVVASSVERLSVEVRPPAAHRGAGGGGGVRPPARRAPPPCPTSATRC